MERKWQTRKPLMLVTLIVFAAVAYSQDRTLKSDSSDNAARPKRTIALKVTAPDGAWARAAVIEGGALKVTDSTTGLSYAFFPLADTNNKRNVTVRVFQVVKSGSTENLYEIENLGISLNSMKGATSNSAFSVEVEAVIKRFSSKDNLAAKGVVGEGDFTTLSSGGGGGSNCCVTCGSMTWCSNCSVLTACGCCNTNQCEGECNP